VIVASLPVTPGPADAGPFTGGQYCAHDPLQFDFDAVSGANEYTVNPFALVSTLAPPIVADFSTAPDPAAGDPAALDGLPAVLAGPEPPAVDDVPHAAAIRATPASPAGTNHRLPITYPTH
jgi:hypothetical protein